MIKKAPQCLNVDLLWQLARIGPPSLSPDGAQVVCAVSQYSMAENVGRSALWLLSTLGGEPRQLTTCGEKDGHPRFSPTGEWIAFIAKRELAGQKDLTPQIYLIAPDGGEARRAGNVPTGVEAFKWFPDGKRIALISWVWPDARGLKAQVKLQKSFSERKETAFVTEDAIYRHWDNNLPMGRVPHLLILDVASGRVTDLFEGTAFELQRRDPGADEFSISSDGQRIVFAYDPARGQNPAPRMALAQLVFEGRARWAIDDLVRDKDWNFSAPSYSPDGVTVAFLASHQAVKHTMPERIARIDLAAQRPGWELMSDDWDREPHAPLIWSSDGSAVLFRAENLGRQPLWRFDLGQRQVIQVADGGTIQAFDTTAGQCVTLTDRASHPAQLYVSPLDDSGHPLPGAPKRIERFNDSLMQGLPIGATEEHWVQGAQGNLVQVWLYFPPEFDRRKKYPLLHTIHGGPHTGPGDNWHWRWNYHLFAAQGYVVANVNYHGSSGFGHAFLDSITHRWGELELQDIEAATDWLLKKPWIARQRVFATGGSYGGYMVAWMNAHIAPGRYKAYVCHAGCFDWVGMFADDAYGWHAQELGQWYWADMAQIHRQSPHAFAATMRTPTLVIHGAKDYRVPDAQGLAYYNTLKAKGVKARLVWFPDENHWILQPRNSALWYQEFFDWLRQHDRSPAKTSRT